MIWNQCTTDLTEAYEYKCAYAAVFWVVVMLRLSHENRKLRAKSMMAVKMGG